MTLRNYGIGAQILKDLRVKKMRLLALPMRMPSMAGFDLEVTGYLQPGDTDSRHVSRNGNGPLPRYR